MHDENRRFCSARYVLLRGLHQGASPQKYVRCQVGLSDHTLDIGVAVAAVALEAITVEKYFTLSRAEGGVDSAFSLEPEELKVLVLESECAWRALGKVFYGPTSREKNSLQFRRSLYITENMNEGDILTEKNLRVIRPGLGLPPKYYDVILGKQIKRDIKKGTPLSWDIVL